MSMSIQGTGSGAYDQQSFGAMTVSKTLDTLNNSSNGSNMAPVDKSTAEASLVSKTMDYMNNGSGYDSNGMSQSYNFQNDVLGAYAKGSLVNTLI